MIQTINANASKAFESGTLVKLSTDNASLTMISVRIVVPGKDPNGTYVKNEHVANLFLTQADFAKLKAALVPGTPFPVVLKYDDTINIALRTNATEFDFGTPPTVCLLTSVPVVNYAQQVIEAS